MSCPVSQSAGVTELAADAQQGLSDLPEDFLRSVLALLSPSPRDVCAVACSCRELRRLAMQGWQEWAGQRWSHGTARWQELQQQGRHLQVYAERHKADAEAARLLRLLPWPLQRDQALTRLLALGMDCYDALVQMALDSRPQCLGRRYWAMHALQEIQVARCCGELSTLVSSREEAGWTDIERAALIVSQVHYPASDLLDESSELTQQLDLLGAELGLRMQEAGVSGGRKALELLNQLLFGDEAPAGTPGRPQLPEPGSRTTTSVGGVGGVGGTSPGAAAAGHFPRGFHAGTSVGPSSSSPSRASLFPQTAAAMGAAAGASSSSSSSFVRPAWMLPAVTATPATPATPATATATTLMTAAPIPMIPMQPSTQTFAAQAARAAPAPSSTGPSTPRIPLQCTLDLGVQDIAAVGALRNRVPSSGPGALSTEEEEDCGGQQHGEGLLRVPPPGYGLGLAGNRDDYSSPRNSLLPAVLTTRLGIPISLCTIHMLVGRRAGLPLTMLNMPMHVISCLKPDPPTRRGGASPGATARATGRRGAAEGEGQEEEQADAEGDAEEEDGEESGSSEEGFALAGLGVSAPSWLWGSSVPGMSGRAGGGGTGGGRSAAEEQEVLFIDAYHNNIMDQEQLRSFMLSLGLPMPGAMQRLQPMSPRSACQRMCANLIEIYSGRQDNTHLKAMLQLSCCLAAGSREALSHHSRLLAILVACNEFDAALRAAAKLRELLMEEEEEGRRSFLSSHLSKFEERMQENRADFHAACTHQAKRCAGGILFRIGDVIRHKRYHYRGVIVEWDAVCSAKEEWMQQMRVDSLPGGRHQPFYKVLVDVRDRFPAQASYIAQCNVELIQGGDVAVLHPEVGRYMDALGDNGRYAPNAELRFRFPDDVVSE